MARLKFRSFGSKDESFRFYTMMALSTYGAREVAWAGSRDGSYALELKDFLSLAADITFGGYINHGLPIDLVIVGESGDWWLEGSESDGEWYWEYHETPKMQFHVCPFKHLLGYAPLAEINAE